MSEQPYADAVAALMEQGYRLEDITEPEVVQQALDHWLRKMIDTAIAHHAACNGGGHQADEHCDGWYALQDALTLMHDNSRRFVQGLLKVSP
jgi:hypothetical protein